MATQLGNSHIFTFVLAIRYSLLQKKLIKIKEFHFEMDFLVKMKTVLGKNLARIYFNVLILSNR